MSVSREQLDASVAKLMRQYSRDVERMGDTVGPNDMGLANYLYGASAALKEYARRYEADHE